VPAPIVQADTSIRKATDPTTAPPATGTEHVPVQGTVGPPPPALEHAIARRDTAHSATDRSAGSAAGSIGTPDGSAIRPDATNGGEGVEREDALALPVTEDQELGSDPVTFAEEMPQFPGGEAAMRQFILEHTKYPEMEREAKVQGRVYMQFVVEKDGALSEIKVVRGLSPGLNKESERLIGSMPKWIPGRQNGKALRVRMTVPIVYKPE